MLFGDDFLKDLADRMEEDYAFDATMGTNYSGFFPEHDEDFDDDDDNSGDDEFCDDDGDDYWTYIKIHKKLYIYYGA